MLVFMRAPADDGGIKNHIGAIKSRESRAFAIPLVTANLHADARVLGIKIRKTQIARRKIKLFIIEWVIGNVHLAVFSEERSIGIQHGAGIVINAGSAALEK